MTLPLRTFVCKAGNTHRASEEDVSEDVGIRRRDGHAHISIVNDANVMLCLVSFSGRIIQPFMRRGRAGVPMGGKEGRD